MSVILKHQSLLALSLQRKILEFGEKRKYGIDRIFEKIEIYSTKVLYSVENNLGILGTWKAQEIEWLTVFKNKWKINSRISITSQFYRIIKTFNLVSEKNLILKMVVWFNPFDVYISPTFVISFLWASMFYGGNKLTLFLFQGIPRSSGLYCVNHDFEPLLISNNVMRNIGKCSSCVCHTLPKIVVERWTIIFLKDLNIFMRK